MPSLDFAVNQTAPIAGSGATKQLVAASAGNAIFLVQVVLASTVADSVIFQDASGGTTLLTVISPANSSMVLPCTGAWWARTTIGNALFFTAATTTTVTAYYLIR